MAGTGAAYAIGEGERLTAGEPWPEVYYHGAHLLQDELSDAEAVLSRMVEQEEFPPEQTSLTLCIYRRRLATNTLPMILTDEEYAVLDVRSEAQRTRITTLLAPVKITLPDRKGVA